jgi:hypothetical protein
LYKSNSLFSVSVIQIRLSEPLRLDKKQLGIVKNIQSSLYNELFNLRVNLDYENFFYGIFIIFLTHTPNIQLDWDLMNAFNFEKFTVYEKLSEPGYIEQAIRNQNIVKFKRNKNRIFCIKQIEKTLKASSKFLKLTNEIAYSQYFEEKYGLETSDKDQSLIELIQVDYNLNFLLKTINFKKEKPDKIRKYPEFFLSEHVFFLPFTKKQTYTLILVPAIIHRLDCLLRALKLKNQIEMQIIKDLNITNVGYFFL